MKSLIIIGAGGHGRVVADVAMKLGVYDRIEFLDDGELNESMGLQVIGKTSDIEKHVKRADMFVAIGNSRIRQGFYERLSSLGATLPTLIHPNAVIGTGVEIGAGGVVMAGSVINPCTKIGVAAIINTSSSVDHDCALGDFVHVSVGAHVAGAVSVGSHTMISVGASVRNNISICDNVLVGAGAVVVKDITESGTYVGVPAKKK